MDRRILAIGIVIVIVAAAAYTVMPRPEGMTIIAESYYQGEKVSSTGPFSYLQDGQPVDELRIVITYHVTVEDVDVTTLRLTGSVEFYLVDQLGLDEDLMVGTSEAFTHDPTAQQQLSIMNLGYWDGTKTISKMLDTFLYTGIPTGYDWAAYGWTIHIYGNIVVSATDNYGNELSESWNADEYVAYQYDDDIGKLTLDVTW